MRTRRVGLAASAPAAPERLIAWPLWIAALHGLEDLGLLVGGHEREGGAVLEDAASNTAV
jgi:hypothetical protein